MPRWDEAGCGVIGNDAQNLVNLWIARDHHRAEISAILGEIQELSRGFPEFSVCFARRAAKFRGSPLC